MLGYCGAWGLGGWLLMLGLWAGFIAVVVWAVSRLFPPPRPPGAPNLPGQQPAAYGTPPVPAQTTTAQTSSTQIVSEQLTRERLTREQLTREHPTRDQMTGRSRPKEGAR